MISVKNLFLQDRYMLYRTTGRFYVDLDLRVDLPVDLRAHIHYTCTGTCAGLHRASPWVWPCLWLLDTTDRYITCRALHIAQSGFLHSVCTDDSQQTCPTASTAENLPHPRKISDRPRGQSTEKSDENANEHEMEWPWEHRFDEQIIVEKKT